MARPTSNVALANTGAGAYIDANGHCWHFIDNSLQDTNGGTAASNVGSATFNNTLKSWTLNGTNQRIEYVATGNDLVTQLPYVIGIVFRPIALALNQAILAMNSGGASPIAEIGNYGARITGSVGNQPGKGALIPDVDDYLANGTTYCALIACRASSHVRRVIAPLGGSPATWDDSTTDFGAPNANPNNYLALRAGYNANNAYYGNIEVLMMFYARGDLTTFDSAIWPNMGTLASDPWTLFGAATTTRKFRIAASAAASGKQLRALVLNGHTRANVTAVAQVADVDFTVSTTQDVTCVNQSQATSPRPLVVLTDADGVPANDVHGMQVYAEVVDV